MEATREEAYFELEGFERLKFWNMAVALQIYRELAKKDPEAYLRFVPMTLNDLAFVDNAQNRWAQARSEVSEALKRAESDPRWRLRISRSIRDGVTNLKMNITIDNWLEFRKGTTRENKHLEFRKSQILEEALDAFANNWKIAMGCQVRLSSADWDTQYFLFTGGECVDGGVNYEL